MKSEKKRVLKRSKTGMETEWHLIDEKGRISNSAKTIINKTKKKYPEINIIKEVGRSMIEFGCYPDVRTFNPSLEMVTSLEKTFEVCSEEGLMIFPFGTYPGNFNPKLTDGGNYDIQKKIYGPEKSEHLGRCVGFHHHYTLPKGVFDAQTKEIKLMMKSKLATSMVNSYNFEIAADPALTLFTQSSPFYQGQHIGKDSRVIVYRGGKKLRYPEGVFSRHQQLGGLPPYKQTATDILAGIDRRYERWKKETKKADPTFKIEKNYPYKLDISWHPVKLNKHGTLEQRGMDVNFMSNVIATTVLIKFVLKHIQREFINIVPTDFAISEPFKLEDNNLYVPPHIHVRDKLQRWSAYKGYAKEDVHCYAKRFYNLAKCLTPKRYKSIIRPIYDMIDAKKSISDRILQYARYKSYVDNGTINDEDAKELALYYANQFSKDLDKTKKKLLRVAAL